MSYVDVFSGNTIQPANKSYNAINLNQSITLSWPTQFLDTGNVVASWMDINASVVGQTLTLPDARLASNGQQIVIVNTGNQTFNLLKNDGNILLETITPSAATCVCLFDNSTNAGQWRSIPFGQGQTAVSQVEATAPVRGITIEGSPINNTGNLIFALSNMLAAMEQLAQAGSKGFIVQKADSELIIRTIESGDANITVANQDGSADNIKISLSPAGISLIQGVFGNLKILENSIVSNNQDGDINITPNGSGAVKVGKNLQAETLILRNSDNFSTSLTNAGTTQGLTFSTPTSYGADNAILQTSSNGQLSFSSLTTTIADKTMMGQGISNINPVVPANLIYGRGSCKAWVVFDGTGINSGVIEPVSNYNVVQISKNGAGSYSITLGVTFTSDMVFSVNAYQKDDFKVADLCFVTAKQVVANSFNIYIVKKDGSTFVDYYRISFAVYGDIS